jgi:hypothetical protein
MLEHPWMIEMRPKRVKMAHFLAKVWDWDAGEKNKLARMESRLYTNTRVVPPEVPGKNAT